MHGVSCSAYFCFPSTNVSVVARFCDGRTYERTDTLRENNDHLFGRGLVGQYSLLVEVSARPRESYLLVNSYD